MTNESTINASEIELAGRLRAFREQAGLSQKAFADVLGIDGVDQQAISRMERSGQIPSSYLIRLRDLGLDVEHFLHPPGALTTAPDPVLHALGLFQNLYCGGIIGVYPDRHAGLTHLLDDIRHEATQVDLTGSSLLGLVRHREVLDAILETLKRNPFVRLRLLLTHPALGFLRGVVEGRRNIHGIQLEIKNAIDEHYEIFLEQAKDRVELRVALHPPTIQALFLCGRRKALINPYTFTVEAYSTNCIIVRDTADKECIFRKYHEFHFEQAWSGLPSGRRASIGLDEYRSMVADGKGMDPLASAAEEFATALRSLADGERIGFGNSRE